MYRAIVSGCRQDASARCIRSALALLEPAYAQLMRCRNWCYESGVFRIQRVGRPVISVGNLTLGGTGKTPFVAWLARWFSRAGTRVAIVSRGYAAPRGSVNDEARELAQLAPQAIQRHGPDRVAAARDAIQHGGAELIILDDGFQHRRLARDLDLVLLDATCPFGFEHVFPRGLLREPASGLARADAVVLTRCEQIEADQREAIRRRAMQLAPDADWLEIRTTLTGLIAAGAEPIPISQLAGLPVLAFCGIGNPEAFRTTLQHAGLHVLDMKTYPDHHRYSQRDVQKLDEWVRRHPTAQTVLCTRKDRVKLSVSRFGRCPVLALAIDVGIETGYDLLAARLAPVLDRAATGR